MRNDTAMSQSPQKTDGSSSGGGGGANNDNAFLRIRQSQQTRKLIHDVSQLLGTGLSPEALDICLKLLESGVHPESLTEVVNRIRRDST